MFFKSLLYETNKIHIYFGFFHLISAELMTGNGLSHEYKKVIKKLSFNILFWNEIQTKTCETESGRNGVFFKVKRMMNRQISS